MTSTTVAFIALAGAAFLQWRGWWSSSGSSSSVGSLEAALGGGGGGGTVASVLNPGRYNLGPRIGALLLLIFGGVALSGGFIGTAVTWTVRMTSGLAGSFAAWLCGPSWEQPVAATLPWLLAAAASLLWFVALAPFTRDQMTWALAWIGTLLPSLAAAIPGDAGRLARDGYEFLADAGASAILAAFT